MEKDFEVSKQVQAGREASADKGSSFAVGYISQVKWIDNSG